MELAKVGIQKVSLDINMNTEEELQNSKCIQVEVTMSHIVHMVRK